MCNSIDDVDEYIEYNPDGYTPEELVVYECRVKKLKNTNKFLLSEGEEYE